MDPSRTLAEVRTYVRDHLRDAGGARCPACGQKAKAYPRRVHATMARALIALYRAGGAREFIHGPSLRSYGVDPHELSTARHWLLVEEEDAVREDGGRAGHWRLTELGCQFVRGHLAIPSRMLIYDAKVIEIDPERVDIRACLGTKFDYDELMGRR